MFCFVCGYLSFWISKYNDSIIFNLLFPILQGADNDSKAIDEVNLWYKALHVLFNEQHTKIFFACCMSPSFH